MPQSQPSWTVEVLYDGDCPLCMREINMLRGRDKQQRIRFTDLTQIDLAAYAPDKSYAELMARIHARLPGGEWIEGVEVFRQLYAAVGFQRLVALSRWPGVRQALDVGYRVFAKNRLRWTGRCEDGSCALPAA